MSDHLCWHFWWSASEHALVAIGLLQHLVAVVRCLLFCRPLFLEVINRVLDLLLFIIDKAAVVRVAIVFGSGLASL